MSFLSVFPYEVHTSQKLSLMHVILTKVLRMSLNANWTRPSFKQGLKSISAVGRKVVWPHETSHYGKEGQK